MHGFVGGQTLNFEHYLMPILFQAILFLSHLLVAASKILHIANVISSYCAISKLPIPIYTSTIHLANGDLSLHQERVSIKEGTSKVNSRSCCCVPQVVTPLPSSY